MMYNTVLLQCNLLDASLLACIEKFEWHKALCGVPQLQVHHAKIVPSYNICNIVSDPYYHLLQIPLVNRETQLPLSTWKRISYHEVQVATNGFSESCLMSAENYKGALSDTTNQRGGYLHKEADLKAMVLELAKFASNVKLTKSNKITVKNVI
ncbi:hypothetical protein J1N35_039207 [Gossypium stocksii]|uniref:Uncharacterized protein n=1 Tax=Gossypium stocksii TaxID=47602 RepID=A0A9D3ZND7_9ROSI|nr:hypothetical protein J1N35_039207 [Gossypium stocksii]